MELAWAGTRERGDFLGHRGEWNRFRARERSSFCKYIPGTSIPAGEQFFLFPPCVAEVLKRNEEKRNPDGLSENSLENHQTVEKGSERTEKNYCMPGDPAKTN